MAKGMPSGRAKMSYRIKPFLAAIVSSQSFDMKSKEPIFGFFEKQWSRGSGLAHITIYFNVSFVYCKN